MIFEAFCLHFKNCGKRQETQKSEFAEKFDFSKMRMKRGALIIFEGCDRSGKTTQCQRLVKYLSDYLPLIGDLSAAKMMRFPDRETEIGKTISGYLKQEQHLDDHVVHLLFSANRWERKNELISALEAGQHVIVDRYAFSGVAFTGS